MTRILQISDPHIVRQGRLVSGRLDTAAPLARLVARIVRIRAQIGPLDAVLVSGDVSDDGSAESYARFRAFLAPLGLPLYVIPGNHDLRAPMRAAFSEDGYLPASDRLNWHQPVGAVDLIGLDTLIEGQGGGTVDAETLQFLRGALRAAGTRPVLLALHHPPFASGIAFMDAIGLSGIPALAAVLSDHRGEIRVVCGHIHNMMMACVAGCMALSSPSPCSRFAFDTRPDAPVGFLEVEDGCLLHVWQNGFRSVRIPMQDGPGPFPF